jgi:hypothetical protein
MVRDYKKVLGSVERTSATGWKSTGRRRAAMLRILTALFLAILLAPASARVSARNSRTDGICAGTVEKLPSNWYYIGIGCSVEPGKASKAILAVCQEGHTCIVHAFGKYEMRGGFYIQRVIEVYELCTATDGTGTTFLGGPDCPPPGGYPPAGR